MHSQARKKLYSTIDNFIYLTVQGQVENPRKLASWTESSIMSLDDAQFSDEHKALMVSYMQSSYCVVDPLSADDDAEDLDTVSADWSPMSFDGDVEVRVEIFFSNGRVF